MTQFTIPGGSEKGVSVEEASSETLSYWIKRCSQSIRDEKSRNPAREQAFIDAMQAVLASRGGSAPADGQRARKAQTQTREPAAAADRADARAARAASALALRSQAESLSGSWAQPHTVLDTIRKARAVAHVVSPQPSCSSILVGCAVASSIVLIDIDEETYPVNSKLGLDKVALERIASAANMSWHPVLSRRIDKGTDPYYVAWRAVGLVRNFDGSWAPKLGNVALDLRSPDTADAAGMSEKELRNARKFILRLAESKAMNRAIRRMGVRTQYTREALEKPFVVMSLVFTGQSDNPEIQKYLMERIADKFLSAGDAMYGGGGAPAALPAGQTPPVLEEGDLPEDDGDDDDDDGDYTEPDDDFGHYGEDEQQQSFKT